MQKHTCFKKGSFSKVWKKLAISMIAGLATIGTGTSMDDTKMIAKDVVEEHNGVYGGKWHIVSPEGFDLPEGLEYLKYNARHLPLKALDDSETSAIIAISNMGYSVTLREVYSLLNKSKAYDIGLVIHHCCSTVDSLCFDSDVMQLVAFRIKNIVINDGILTFRDLWSLVVVTWCSDVCCYLSNIVFINKDWTLISNIPTSINSIKYEPPRIFEIRNCNLNEFEKSRLQALLGIHMSCI